ncbi:glycosyltransferase [Halobacillus hunanensis]|uniref:glycosyltransferase n=1 Tax=Halobacillus hunanensis TaxID=578214 RepID=UPI0009A6D6F5|nr:glycosyltransferase [Halobacillus hunanensis]
MKTIVMLTGVTFNSLKQRPHHMAKHFSTQGYRVVFLPIIGDKVVLQNCIIKKLSFQKLLEKYSKEVKQNLFVMKKLLYDTVGSENGLEEILEIIERDAKGKVTFIVSHPNWGKYIAGISTDSKLIYDCLDDWESFVNDLDWGYQNDLIHYERKIASMADLVIVSARSLYLKMAHLNENIYYLPNGVWNKDYSFNNTIQTQDIPKDTLSINKPIVFFMGAIAGWVDTELIRFVAESRPEYSFVFIGAKVKKRLPEISNIYFLGQKKYEELPSYLSQAKVAIIPFKVNRLTTAVTPLKFYEYLSSSTPVVTTMMPDLIGIKGSQTALNYKDFLTYIDKYIYMDDAEYKLESQRAKTTSEDFDWNKLFEPLTSFINDENFRTSSVDNFTNKMIQLYESYKQNNHIKNELLCLYNIQRRYSLSLELLTSKENIEDKLTFDYIQMALAYFQVGHYEKSVQVLTKNQKTKRSLLVYIDSIANDIDNREVLLQIFLFKMSGDIYEAIRLADEAIQVRGNSRKLLGLLAGLYLDLGEYGSAFHFATEAIRIRENLKIEDILDIDCITFLIEFLTKKQQHELAEEVVLLVMTNKELEESCINMLSTIYFSKAFNHEKNEA